MSIEARQHYHNLNLLPLFTSIYVFQRGKIVEPGSLDALLAKKGHLAKLWETRVVHVQENETIK